MESGKKSLGAIKRRRVRISTTSMVHTEPMFGGRRLPLVITPAGSGVDLMAWAAENYIADRVVEHGGILFRNFGVRTTNDFERFIAVASGKTLEYSERSSPRTRVTNGNI